MLRRLRILASYACLALAIAAAMQWVQSFWIRIDVRGTAENYYCGLSSWKGLLAVTENCTNKEQRGEELAWECQVLNLRDYVTAAGAAPSWRPLIVPRAFTFEYRKSWGVTSSPVDLRSQAALPHWVVVLVCFGLAIAIRPPPHLRWSLRDAFASMTIAAVAALLLKLLVDYSQR